MQLSKLDSLQQFRRIPRVPSVPDSSRSEAAVSISIGRTLEGPLFLNANKVRQPLDHSVRPLLLGPFLLGSLDLVFWRKGFCASCNRGVESLYFSTGAVPCLCEIRRLQTTAPL